MSRGGGTTTDSVTQTRIPAPVAPWMARATREQILDPLNHASIPGNQDDIAAELVDQLAVFMVGRADIRSPFLVERVTEQHDGITRVDILVAHYDPYAKRSKCYRLQYPIESLLKMAWYRGPVAATKKIKGWIAIRTAPEGPANGHFATEFYPFGSNDDGKSSFDRSEIFRVVEVEIEVPA